MCHIRSTADLRGADRGRLGRSVSPPRLSLGEVLAPGVGAVDYAVGAIYAVGIGAVMYAVGVVLAARHCDEEVLRRADDAPWFGASDS